MLNVQSFVAKHCSAHSAGELIDSMFWPILVTPLFSLTNCALYLFRMHSAAAAVVVDRAMIEVSAAVVVVLPVVVFARGEAVLVCVDVNVVVAVISGVAVGVDVYVLVAVSEAVAVGVEVPLVVMVDVAVVAVAAMKAITHSAFVLKYANPVVLRRLLEFVARYSWHARLPPDDVLNANDAQFTSWLHIRLQLAAVRTFGLEMTDALGSFRSCSGRLYRP